MVPRCHPLSPQDRAFNEKFGGLKTLWESFCVATANGGYRRDWDAWSSSLLLSGRLSLVWPSS
eukprot:6424278-Amphidinium_carterae.1